MIDSHAKAAIITGRLSGWVQAVGVLTRDEQAQMYALMTRYFANLTREQFEHDLAEKESVILLVDDEQRIRGFSTLMRLQVTVDEQPVVAFFSGDTIIEREYWGETVLPRLWAQHVFGLAAELKDIPAYWFLICSGYKTYRFLPVFFHHFYPTYKQATPPPIQAILDTVAKQKFGDEYNPQTGIIRFTQATPLRPNVAHLSERRLRNPHIAFFAKKNPGHIQGDELACLTRIDPANLTPAGRRMLG